MLHFCRLYKLIVGRLLDIIKGKCEFTSSIIGVPLNANAGLKMCVSVLVVSFFDADIFELDAWDVINGMRFEDDYFFWDSS